MDDYINASAYGDKELERVLSQELDVYTSAINKAERERKAAEETAEAIVKSGADVKSPTYLGTREIDVTIDDVGYVTLSDKSKVGTAGRWLLSREHNMDKILEGAVSDYTTRAYRAKGLDQQLKQLIKEVKADISVFRRDAKAERVNAWLLAGDEKKQLWSIDLMRNGYGDVPKLTDAEIAAYYKMRDVADTLFYVNNRIRRDALDFAG